MVSEKHVSEREYKRTYDKRRKLTHRRVNLTMTAEDYAIFEQLAHDLDTSEAKAILHLAKAGVALVPPPVPKSTRDLIRESLVTIRRAGNVFNQCAKHWHRKSFIPEHEKPLWIENCEFLAHHFQRFEKTVKRLEHPQKND